MSKKEKDPIGDLKSILADRIALLTPIEGVGEDVIEMIEDVDKILIDYIGKVQNLNKLSVAAAYNVGVVVGRKEMANAVIGQGARVN